MHELFSALRRTARSLAARPGFTAVVVATLALGIGANTAVFSFVNALLLRPMPFERPERLVQVQAVVDDEPGRLTAREFEKLKREADHFVDFAAYAPSQYNLTGEGEPEALLTTINTEELFCPIYGSLYEGSPDRARDGGSNATRRTRKGLNRRFAACWRSW